MEYNSTAVVSDAVDTDQPGVLIPLWSNRTVPVEDDGHPGASGTTSLIYNKQEIILIFPGQQG